MSESHRRHGKTSDEHPLRLAIFFITHFSFLFVCSNVLQAVPHPPFLPLITL